MRTLLVLACWLAATLPSWGEGPVIVAFGDSITLGAGVKPDESYPARLEALRGQLLETLDDVRRAMHLRTD